MRTKRRKESVLGRAMRLQGGKGDGPRICKTTTPLAGGGRVVKFWASGQILNSGGE